MSETDFVPVSNIFSPTIIKGLSEKNVDKRKQALEELER